MAVQLGLTLPVRSSLCWHLLNARCLHLSVHSFSHHGYSANSVKTSLKDHYSVLQVPSDCDEAELKNAFVSLAKQYHPDGGQPSADATKFANVEQAFRTIRKHRRGVEDAEKAEEMEQVIFDIKHTAPQHRQYLTYDGVGHGSPSQRLRQYQQHKFFKAYENVYDYRTQKVSAKYEDAMVVKDKRAARKTAIKNTLHRIAEDLISEMINKGDFDNLPGKGQPLQHKEYNPMVDSMTHNLNKILIQNGYAPEWVMLDREIRQMMEVAHKSLMAKRLKLGPEPLSPGAKRDWDYAVLVFKETIEQVNKKIADFNILVPSLKQQKMTYSTKREIQKILKTYKEMLDSGHLADLQGKSDSPPENAQDPISQYKPEAVQGQSASLRDVWKEVKSLFTSS